MCRYFRTTKEPQINLLYTNPRAFLKSLNSRIYETLGCKLHWYSKFYKQVVLKLLILIYRKIHFIFDHEGCTSSVFSLKISLTAEPIELYTMEKLYKALWMFLIYNNF